MEECATRLWYYAQPSTPSKAQLVAKFESLLKEEFGLGGGGLLIARKWLETMSRTDEAGQNLARVRSWLLCLVNGRSRGRPVSPFQQGCPDLVPHLDTRALWPVDHFGDWLVTLQRNVQVIQSELMQYKGRALFQPYRAPLWANPDRPATDGFGSQAHDSGDWNVLYLLLHNVDYSENARLFPETMKLLKSVPRLYQHAFFSILSPDTHITPHNGPTNKKLRIHIPLFVPADGSKCAIRVGDVTTPFRVGEPIIFDDSFQHEAYNESTGQARVCLIFDIWHPSLTDREVVFMKFLEKGKMNLAKRTCDEHTSGGGGAIGMQNFYELLRTVQLKLKTDTWADEIAPRQAVSSC